MTPIYPQNSVPPTHYDPTATIYYHHPAPQAHPNPIPAGATAPVYTHVLVPQNYPNCLPNNPMAPAYSYGLAPPNYPISMPQAPVAPAYAYGPVPPNYLNSLSQGPVAHAYTNGPLPQNYSNSLLNSITAPVFIHHPALSTYANSLPYKAIAPNNHDRPVSPTVTDSLPRNTTAPTQPGLSGSPNIVGPVPHSATEAAVTDRLIPPTYPDSFKTSGYLEVLNNLKLDFMAKYMTHTLPYDEILHYLTKNTWESWVKEHWSSTHPLISEYTKTRISSMTPEERIKEIERIRDLRFKYLGIGLEREVDELWQYWSEGLSIEESLQSLGKVWVIRGVGQRMRLDWWLMRGGLVLKEEKEKGTKDLSEKSNDAQMKGEVPTGESTVEAEVFSWAEKSSKRAVGCDGEETAP